MKKILIIMTGVFVLACNNGKDKKTDAKIKFNDLVAENLKGNILSIEEYPYKTDSTGKAGERDSCCVLINVYDNNGNNSGWATKDNNGNIREEEITIRYPNGMWNIQKFQKYRKTTYAIEAKMDDKNKYTIINEYNSSGVVEFYYTGIVQNEVGQILGWKQFNKDSVFTGVGETQYNNYQKTGFIFKDTTGKVRTSNSFKYNEKGELIEKINSNLVNDSMKTVVTKFTYQSYDSTGNWTQRTTWNEKGNATTITKRVYVYRKE